MHNYLGMQFNFGESEVCAFSMPKYVQEILEESGVTGSASSPATHNLFDVVENSHLLPEAERQNFHSKVAKLRFVAKRTRPDLLPLISFLTTRVLHATEEDQDKLRRGLRYLNSITSMGIVRLWSSGDKRIRFYFDASYRIHHDRKSHAVLYLTLGGGPISVKSCKLKLMMKSSTEAEVVAMSDMCSTLLWALECLRELDYNVKSALVY